MTLRPIAHSASGTTRVFAQERVVFQQSPLVLEFVRVLRSLVIRLFTRKRANTVRGIRTKTEHKGVNNIDHV